MATITKTKAFNIDKLVEWLESNDGVEVHRFELGTPSEQNADARTFAEKMRKNIGTSRAVEVVQSYNKVTISVVKVGALSA